MQPRSYRTLAGAARAEIEVRRSRFVCDVEPVPSEEDARAVVERVRAASRDAGHHCTAFLLGPDASTVRSNDDGEPSGTAGAPMLEVLRGAGLTDVVAVVTRWFGGTLLGTGGLIRAYGDAVGAAVSEARVVTMSRRTATTVEVGHADGPRVDNALRALPDATVTGVDYLAEGVRLHVAVDPESLDAFGGTVAALTSGAGRVTPGADLWVPADPDA
ncbi:IMPACT family protein [Intrasporangium flavum]|uniref:IMPACT family protein n=1 Tax=Intrasporangium flavum TaxID=1428657 RepID=UPI00096FAA7F|nr:YigZ family protein [Intrasporangium flavum]